MRLDWPDCRNVRDLGGLPTIDGRRTRQAALVRADCLDRLSPAGMGAVRDYGVVRILDLRASWELRGNGHPFAGDPSYLVSPFIDESRDHERDPSAEHTLADLYRGSIDRNGRCIAESVRNVVTAPPGPVVMHCLSGADRTGMLAALVLDAVGVERDAIVTDYARTHEVYDTPDGRPSTVTITETMQHLRTAHGGSRSYLRTNGLTDVELDGLRDRMIDGIR